MKSLVVFCCLLAVVLATDTEFQSFKIKFNRKYKNPTEEVFRKKIFLNNLMQIKQHNHRFSEGKATFTMGVNQYADLTTQEFSEVMNNYEMQTPNPDKIVALPAVGANPVSIDYRDSGCITPIKDQGQCGSCWSFSVTGSTEYVNCKAKSQNNNPVALSEQYLIDCTFVPPYFNKGCNGGFLDRTFQFVIDNFGVPTENSYPYTATSSRGNCKTLVNKVGTISQYQFIQSGNEDQLEKAVAATGPVSVAIDASLPSFQLYQSGVYSDPLCSSTQLDHAVLAIGYGVDNGVSYWLVKNSWGVSWGLDGYIKMAKDSNNQCGIATQAIYPIF